MARIKYKEYLLGETIRLRVKFRVSNTIIDPDDVILKVKDPDGTVIEYKYSEAEIIRESTGIYYVDVVGNQVGQWYYRFEGTGSAAGVEEYGFCVYKSNVIEESDL